MSMGKGTKEQKWGYRHIVVIVAFLTFFQQSIQRLCSAVAIVAMINDTSITISTERNSSLLSCPLTQNSSIYSTTQKIPGEFNWNSDVLGYINGAAFIGMFSGMLFGMKLTEMCQSKRLVLYSLITSSIAVGISPLASRWNVYAFITALLVRGCGESLIALAFFVLMGNWFPRAETGLLSTIALTGYSVGGIVAGIVAGWICEEPHLGWPAVFYIAGGLSMSMSILVLVVLYESPNEHPRITKEELNHITDTIQVSVTKESTPWAKIFSTTSTYAVMLALFGGYWFYSYFWSVSPTYLGAVLHLPIKENGLSTSIPYAVKIVGEYIACSLSHWLLKKDYVSIDTSRKLCTVVASVGFSGAVLGIYFAGCNSFVSVIFSSVGMFFVGVATPGAEIACMDMTKKFTGPLSGITNIVGSTAAFILPVVTGYLTPNQTLQEWNYIFFLTIAVVMISAIVFAIFGSAEIQPWNFEDPHPEKDCQETQNPEQNIYKTELCVIKLSSLSDAG